jgi:hypothetical protein
MDTSGLSERLSDAVIEEIEVDPHFRRAWRCATEEQQENLSKRLTERLTLELAPPNTTQQTSQPSPYSS